MNNEIEKNGEDDFIYKINTIATEFTNEFVRDGYFSSFDGKKIHYYQCINPREKAAIVIFHGFCEFFDKYLEVVYELFQMDYSIFFIEHRGHGKSYRDKDCDMDMVYIDSFDTYVEDAREFIDKVVAKESKTKKYFLFAHSMGGCIGGLFLEKYPSYFKAAILSSPMMQVNVGRTPDVLAKIMMTIVNKLNLGKKYAPGEHGFDGIYKYENSSALSEARYKFMFQMREKNPEYRTYGGTNGWLLAAFKATRKVKKNAEKIETPLLLFQAGKDDMVIPKGQDEFLKKVRRGKKISFPESKHEIFNATKEIRDKFYLAICEFFDSNT